jgi:hypothetical protein
MARKRRWWMMKRTVDSERNENGGQCTLFFVAKGYW